MSGKYRVGEDAIPHFVSFSVVNWIDALSRVDYKDIFLESVQHCIDHNGLAVHAWVIMPNHVHLIISCEKSEPGISGILRDCKKYTSNKIIEAIATNPKESRKESMLLMFAMAGKKNCNNIRFQFWQQDNHPIELNTNIKLDQRLTYLHENPVRAGIVYEPQHYIYSSAVDYYTENEKGKLKIVHLYYFPSWYQRRRKSPARRVSVYFRSPKCLAEDSGGDACHSVYLKSIYSCFV